jgi:hypothetical protein
MPFDKDSEWWPSITTPENAIRAMQYGSSAATLVAVITAVIGGSAIYLGHPVLGMHGWILMDAALFSLVAWRMYRLSLPWSIVGLVLFTAGRLYSILNNPHLLIGGIVGTVVFFPAYLNAVRGGLYLRRTRTHPVAYPPASVMNEALEAEAWTMRPADLQQTNTATSSMDEYEEFLNCMRRGERKFQKARFTVQEEYAAWLKDRRKKLAIARAAAEKASSARSA